ncbi:MAG: glycoside hydrolase family 88 protein [Bacteroidales bacterium]|nr:glycoside hydrolase family 88 protein [Bacteroidales bacterium]
MKPFTRHFLITVAAFVCLAAPLSAQGARPQNNPQRPDPTVAVKEVIDRIFNYIDGCTPTAVVDGNGKVLRDYDKIDASSTFQKGDFGINTYEWGVTYSALLLASEVTGEEKYTRYVNDRLELLGKVYPYVKKYYEQTGYQMRLGALENPKWLDDCGSMTAAMIKATLADRQKGQTWRGLLDNWFDFVMYEEYRLGDGILARNRPTTNSVWLDDMYMGITPIAYRGLLSQVERGDLTQKYYNEAIRQVLLFKNYLWVPEKNLFRHGWIEGMSEHPDYHWARCNGWAVLTLCDVLDAVPERTQGWTEVRDLLVSLLRGIAPYQSPEGTWHQLIDKTESYLETSASAMFVYGYAHAINKGWIDRTAYQDIARSGWAGVAKQVNEKGQVENTCVGTGLGWTNTFYESRPVSVFAAHGYGPVLLAATELIKMYKTAPAPAPAYRPGGAAPAIERDGDKPFVWLAGDSTCKNGRGTGDNGQWGWGSFFGEYLTDAVHVQNEAVGGLSSRTFYNGTQWPRIRDNVRKGDYVLIQFGHNDMSPLGTGRARGTLDGTGDEPQRVVMERDGSSQNVYSYGHYLRMMIRQAKMRGAVPIVVSPTPQNRWNGEKKIERFTDTFNDWCRNIAREEGVTFVDFNDICAAQYESIGRTQAQKDYFADSVHTREKGARLYCKVLADALREQGTPLKDYVR